MHHHLQECRASHSNKCAVTQTQTLRSVQYMAEVLQGTPSPVTATTSPLFFSNLTSTNLSVGELRANTCPCSANTSVRGGRMPRFDCKGSLIAWLEVE